jgi:DNA invertase Pin-like site-specific DNA recombinase
MKYGYARVSTDGQKVAAQVAALKAAGAGKVFREVASGAKTQRAQLRKAIGALVVTRLDRLARSTRDLLNHRQQGRVSVSERHMGGYHHITRAAYAYRLGRACRV